ncbi:MAG: hypothetical protein IPM86_02330 [Saprospiraceae bacterium]|nr:hypothetical protein [Saprospiraceae bacterium]
MKIKFILLVLFLCSTGSNTAFAQLSNGSPAPDFAVTTITGGSYSLYGAMGANKAACLDFMATWCGPCWTFIRVVSWRVFMPTYLLRQL